MPRVCYKRIALQQAALGLIEQCNVILRTFAADGYDMTLRQLYYQIVAQDLFPDDRRWRQIPNTKKWVRDPYGTKNAEPNYKWLGDVMGDARVAGLVDWDHLVDRTREIKSISHWESPADITAAVAKQYAIDKWDSQPHRVECFPPETPILTSDGVTLIGSILVGDTVLAGDGTFQRVTKVFRQQYDGELIRVGAVGNLPVRVTPNHPVWAVPYDPRNPGYKGKERNFLAGQWVNSESLKQFDLLTIPKIKETRDVATVPMIGGARSINLPAVPVDELLCKTIGIYLAEGNVRCDGRTIQFTLAYKEEAYAQVLKEWANSVGLNASEAFGPGTRIIYIFSRAAALWFADNFGNGAFHKKLPEWFLTLPSHKQIQSVEYYFRGDGSFWDESRSAIAAGTRSISLAYQMQLLLVRLGYPPSIDESDDHGEPRYRVSIGGSHAARLSEEWGIAIPTRTRRYNHILLKEDGAHCPVRTVESEPYSGEVVNLEVENQHTYCVPFTVHNCWIEKEALAGVFARVCRSLDVPYFACKGYTSLSEMWRAAQRLEEYNNHGQIPIILHFGDHDPSGIDMTRDISDRLELFMGEGIAVNRLALNMDQVRLYDPPPNPTKLSDSRAKVYIQEYGYESWELDALRPDVLAQLVEDAIEDLRDPDAWAKAVKREEKERLTLNAISKHFDEVGKHVRQKGWTRVRK